MPTYDIIQITRNRVRHTITAATLEEAVRKWDQGGGSLEDDETLDVEEEWVTNYNTDEDVTDAWNNAQSALLDEQMSAKPVEA